MLEEILANYSEQIRYFFESIDLKQAQKVEKELLACGGNVIFIGVGKSGIIAEKLAKTMVATGSPSFAMNAMNALHGDIGSLKPADVVILLSKSGETEELLNLIPFIQKRGVVTIGWTSYAQSKLAKKVDMACILPMKQEICPFNLAPTTSSTVQLIFGHILAVSIMQKKGMTLSEYAENHPAGNIGKRINLKVADVMKSGQEVPKCLLGTSIREGLFELTSKQAGCVIIENKEGKIEGVFTDGDLRRALQSQGSQVLETPIEDLMTRAFISIEEKMSAFEAMSMMNRNKKVNALPVLKDKTVVGLIRMHDLVEQGILQ